MFKSISWLSIFKSEKKVKIPALSNRSDVLVEHAGIASPEPPLLPITLSSLTLLNDDEVCWICMCKDNEKNEQLLKQCDCPGNTRLIHSDCLAKWEIHNIGREEEIKCRFCKKDLSIDWKEYYKPKPNNNIININIIYNNHQYSLLIDQGKSEDLKDVFVNFLKDKFNINIDEKMSIRFETKFNNTQIVNQDVNSIDKMLYLASYNASLRI